MVFLIVVSEPSCPMYFVTSELVSCGLIPDRLDANVWYDEDLYPESTEGVKELTSETWDVIFTGTLLLYNISDFIAELACTGVSVNGTLPTLEASSVLD